MWAGLLAMAPVCDDETIASVMLDPALPIGAHLRDQPNPAAKLAEQIEKARKKVDSKKPCEEAVVVCVADVPAKEIEWLWPQRFARNKIGLIAGQPGLGKSQVTCALAAAVTTRGPWPNNEGSAPLGNVVMLSAEDDVADTLRPRLEAAGADVQRVHVLEAIKVDGGGRRGFDLSQDIQRLEQVVSDIGDVVLVIVDPLTAYLGKIDSHRAADVRGVLAPLQDFASRHRAAVIGVTHLSKGGSNEALSRFIGSIGFVGAARAAFLVAKDRDDPTRRLFLPAKNNVGNDQTGLAFRIVEKPASHPLRAPAVEWLESVTITADEAMAADDKSDRVSRLDAKSFLELLLAGGPLLQTEIDTRAAQQGISPDQLKRAKKKLGIWSKRAGGIGGSGHWLWGLPDQAPPGAQAEIPF